MRSKEEVILAGYEIAARDLRACYNPDGIVAGRTHFNSYWSRDGFWGIFGALELRDFDQASRSLELFVRHQRPSGQIPVRIEFLTHAFGRYHGMRTRLAPVFRAAHIANPVDPAALYVIALWQYYRHTGDKIFLQKHFDSVRQAITWLSSLDRDGDGLIETGLLADWMDSVIKIGEVLNLNVIYYKALDNFSSICAVLQRGEDSHHVVLQAKRTKKAIQAHFWNGEYFSDRHHAMGSSRFSADGNVLAILYEIAKPAQAKIIFQFVNRHRLELHAGLRVVHPPYPWFRIVPIYFLYGIPDYHTGMLWPWITSLYALTKWRAGKKQDALDTLYNQAQLFLRRGFVAEVYDNHGMPVHRSIYQSEVPFAWNAAAFIYAVKSIGLAGRHMVTVH